MNGGGAQGCKRSAPVPSEAASTAGTTLDTADTIEDESDVVIMGEDKRGRLDDLKREIA